MCGINGIIDFSKTKDANFIKSLIKNMNDKIIYRGPDDTGIFINKNFGFGMRRLSIIDLMSGHQPMFNADKNIAVVFNGEIYNYNEIKNNLKQLGYTFATHSNTEVIIYAYEEYGTNCFNMFDGMFAIAIYDQNKNEVILGRDKVGEKPLYYYKDTNNFIFGSELKSLMGSGLIKKNINLQALYYYFTLMYIPAPYSIYDNIYKLEAGHYLRISLNGDICKKQYWDLIYDKDNLIDDYDECKKKLRQALFKSVESRMISDVPIGAFMSGGIDSTTIAGIMSQISNVPINTFTIGFDNKNYDESDIAKIAAKKFGSNHHLEYFSTDKAFGIIDKIVDNMDEPFADSSALPTYFVSNIAANHVKVVLTGDCGDELFAGYSKYLIGYYANKYRKIPYLFRLGFEKYGVKILPALSSLRRKVEKVIVNANEDLFTQRLHLMQLGCYDEEYRKLSVNFNNINNDLINQYYEKYAGRTDEVSQTLYTDLKIVLEGDMFVKVDRMSMLNSLETRTPMVSNEMLEIASRIPTKFKINGKAQKIIFKDTFKDILPTQLLYQTKRGFGVPIDYWFRNGLKNDLESRINVDIIKKQGLFNYEYIYNLYNEHQKLKSNHKNILWAIYIFQRWYEREFGQ